MNDNELKLAIAEVAKTAGNSPNGRSAMAELIVRMVDTNHLTLDLFNSFMPVTQLNPGDELQLKVKKGKYPVRSMVPGTMHLADQVYVQDKIMRAFDRLIAGARCSVWELQSGEMGTAAEMRAQLKADLFDTLVSRVYNLISTVWNSTDTPSNYFDASSGGVTSTVLDAAIENVLERAGSVRAIFGSRRALYPVYGFSTSVPVVTVTGQSGTAIPTDRFNEFYNTNKVTSYKGIPMIELSQVFAGRLPDVNEKLIRTDTIVVVGDNAGEIALMGGFEYQDYTDMRTQPAEYILHGWQQYAMTITNPDRIAVVLSNT